MIYMAKLVYEALIMLISLNKEGWLPRDTRVPKKWREKVDFIESQQHNTIQDRYQISCRGSEPYQNPQLWENHCRTAWNLSWALKKSWDLNRRRGGAKPQEGLVVWTKPQGRGGARLWITSKGFSFMIWPKLPWLSGGLCVTGEFEFLDKNDWQLSEDFSWKAEKWWSWGAVCLTP